MSSIDEHVPALDVDVEVLEDPHDARGVGRGAVARDRHEVDLARDRDRAHQVGHEEDRALEHADEQQLAAGVVGGDLRAELADARLQALLVDQDLADRPARARSATRGTRLDPLGLDDPGHRDDLVAAHDERPAFAVGARDLGVDEHVLDLLRAAGEPVAGPPSADDKAWQLGADAPPPQRDLAVELDRAAARARAGRARARPGRRRRGRRASSRPARRAARRAPAAACGARRARAGCSRAPPDGSARAAAGSRRGSAPRVVAGVRRVDAERRARARGRTPRSPRARAAAAGARRRPRARLDPLRRSRS